MKLTFSKQGWAASSYKIYLLHAGETAVNQNAYSAEVGE